jgi:hypothetical protein
LGGGGLGGCCAIANDETADNMAVNATPIIKRVDVFMQAPLNSAECGGRFARDIE